MLHRHAAATISIVGLLGLSIVGCGDDGAEPASLCDPDQCRALHDDCVGATDGNGPICGLRGAACPVGYTCTCGHQAGWDYCHSQTDDSVHVPSGPFFMGCNTDSAYEATVCSDDEKDGGGGSHQVMLDAFEIQRTEVSKVAYGQCPESAGCKSVSSADDLPAASLDWSEAAAYCTWLDADDGATWRLCSEAEWEKAARGGCETLSGASGGCQSGMRVYPWNPTHVTLPATCDHAWIYDWDSDAPSDALCGDTLFSTEVDSLGQGASPYGLLHMAGNISEWVQDCWHAGYHGFEGGPEDGMAWETGCASTDRVMKGGNYRSPPESARAASRFGHGPEILVGHNIGGVRCCRPVGD